MPWSLEAYTLPDRYKPTTTNEGAVSINPGYNGNLSFQVAQWLRIHLPMQETQTRDLGSIPGSGRFPGGGHGNPLQYSCLENPMDGGLWQATVQRVTKSRTWLKQLSTHKKFLCIWLKSPTRIKEQVKELGIISRNSPGLPAPHLYLLQLTSLPFVLGDITSTPAPTSGLRATGWTKS